jgi:hypothetical protein
MGFVACAVPNAGSHFPTPNASTVKSSIRVVIVLLAIAVLAIAFEQMGKSQQYVIHQYVCVGGWKDGQPPGVVNWISAEPVTTADCPAIAKRSYPWVTSFSLIAVAVVAAAGAAWVINERRA